MKLFFDTSALVKFFHEEEGTQKVTELINSEENEIWILEIASLEFLSALFRRFRNNEINEEELEVAISSFEEQIDSFNVEPLGNATIKEAKSLLKKYGKVHGLRTLDAFHLGAFNLVCEEDWYFVTSDSNLYQILEEIGFKTINPLN
ncbi:MAG: PIN domain-containing protein [Candidatus Aminicenantes bacterium]|nr:PIN domain-containing protein [Candidatus Aminicenantes bacterium]NIM77561.1 PIN domain-containing protein [Candidatus Aminicenantes bacterium]NIN16883.1 PIN domain-containing protein [Candidatus Aminicenantes bacterium]NIN40771.1 PIN domain-containing protein [Candidatus Aminicenantes bacterium]NIN83580.1 PIN domain-containing protein [Candidatus Aminicenantes bacterium]